MKIKVGLIVVVIGVILFIHFLFINSSKTNRVNLLIRLCLFLSCIYIVGSIYFYNFSNRYHWFDPYYQVSPPEFTTPFLKPQNEYRVLVLGGSTSRDPRKEGNKNYPFLLQELLQKKYPDKKIVVLNSGMNWFSAKHSLLNYTEYGHLFQPDLVIVLQGINDVYRSFTPRDFALGEFHPSYKHFYGASYYGAKSQTLESLFFNPDLNDYRDYRATDFPFSAFKAYPSFVQFEAAIANYVQADGARCLLLSQPSLYRTDLPDTVINKLWFGKYLCNKNTGKVKTYPNTASMKMAMDSFNRAVQRIAQTKKCLYLDADAYIPKNTTYFYDDVHFTNNGSKLLAKTIFDYIIENNVLEKKAMRLLNDSI